MPYHSLHCLQYLLLLVVQFVQWHFHENRGWTIPGKVGEFDVSPRDAYFGQPISYVLAIGIRHLLRARGAETLLGQDNNVGLIGRNGY